MMPLIPVAAWLFVSIAPVLAVWPAPTSITTGTSTLWIERTIAVTYNGDHLSWGSEYDETSYGPNATSNAIVNGAVSRAMEAILEKNFVPWKLYPRNALKATEPSTENKKLVKSLAITQTAQDNATTWKPLASQGNESYSLSLDAEGAAKIEAVSAVGILRALETFTQLFFLHSNEKDVYTTKAPVRVTDAPQYAHRGILLDVARTYFPVDNIYRTLDAMAWNKLNRLHIHATDSQSWPLEIPAMPEVAEKGAYSPGKTYTAKDVTAIQKYAVARGIEVIFEIDTPGHIGVLAESHPNLVTAWQAEPWSTYCAEPPCGQFRLNESSVDTFLDKLAADLFPRLEPYSAYFHTGGDEVNVQEYLLDPTVRSNDTAVVYPLIQKFIDKQHARVRKAGMTPMVWEEIVSTYNITIGDDVVVQSWLGGTAVGTLAAAGHKVIDSNYEFWYLDCGRGQFLNFGNGASFDSYYPFNDWCTPAKPWQLIYSHNPVAGLSAEAAGRVIGGELAVWSETIDEQNLDSLTWPRASAAGEVLWSGRVDAGGQNRSQIEAAPRLHEFRERMVARGVGAAPFQMTYCSQGMNGTTCSM